MTLAIPAEHQNKKAADRPTYSVSTPESLAIFRLAVCAIFRADREDVRIFFPHHCAHPDPEHLVDYTRDTSTTGIWWTALGKPEA